MKNFLILTIALVSLFSCSDDDKNLDPYVGTWSLYSKEGIKVSECESKSFTEVKENGTFISINYGNNNDEGKCKSDKDEGKWSNSGNNIYSSFLEGDITPRKAHITFKDNNNTLVMIYLGKDGESTSNTSTYKRK